MVIAIIGVLVALLLPAVQSARESARRSQCINNIKQLALGCMTYHDAKKIFPPALTYSEAALKARGYTPVDGGMIGIDTNPYHGPNWVILILPFIEQQTLYKQFDLTQYISADINRMPRGQSLQLMLCPTDAQFNSEPFSVPAALGGDNWARGDYGANSSLSHAKDGNIAYSPTQTAPACIWFGTCSWGDLSWTRGVMGGNTSLAIKQIDDGTSNTVLLTELRAGLSPGDRRGIWAMGMAGASSVWGIPQTMPLAPTRATTALTTSSVRRKRIKRSDTTFSSKTAWESPKNPAQAGAFRLPHAANTPAASLSPSPTAARPSSAITLKRIIRPTIQTLHTTPNHPALFISAPGKKSCVRPTAEHLIAMRFDGGRSALAHNRSPRIGIDLALEIGRSLVYVSSHYRTLFGGRVGQTVGDATASPSPASLVHAPHGRSLCDRIMEFWTFGLFSENPKVHVHKGSQKAIDANFLEEFAPPGA